jgi:predicted ArsR family transcriptional regulator
MRTGSTRTRILDLIEKEHSATAEEISRSLDLTASAVRYHLARMENEGLIEIDEHINRREAGRPAQAFRVSSSTRPNHLAGLSTALLSMRLSQSDAEADELVWADLAKGIAGTVPGSTLLSLRLSHCIRELNRMNYQARWEAGPHGPRIFLSNCPYTAIWHKFPGLCQMDRHLLEDWMGREFFQTSRIDFQGRKHKSCVFDG